MQVLMEVDSTEKELRAPMYPSESLDGEGGPEELPFEAFEGLEPIIGPCIVPDPRTEMSEDVLTKACRFQALNPAQQCRFPFRKIYQTARRSVGAKTPPKVLLPRVSSLEIELSVSDKDKSPRVAHRGRKALRIPSSTEGENNLQTTEQSNSAGPSSNLSSSIVLGESRRKPYKRIEQPADTDFDSDESRGSIRFTNKLLKESGGDLSFRHLQVKLGINPDTSTEQLAGQLRDTRFGPANFSINKWEIGKIKSAGRYIVDRSAVAAELAAVDKQQYYGILARSNHNGMVQIDYQRGLVLKSQPATRYLDSAPSDDKKLTISAFKDLVSMFAVMDKVYLQENSTATMNMLFTKDGWMELHKRGSSSHWNNRARHLKNSKAFALLMDRTIIYNNLVQCFLYYKLFSKALVMDFWRECIKKEQSRKRHADLTRQLEEWELLSELNDRFNEILLPTKLQLKTAKLMTLEKNEGLSTQVINAWMGYLNQTYENTAAFSTHAYHLGTGGYSKLYNVAKIFLDTMDKKMTGKMLFPALALNGTAELGVHLSLFVADRKLKTIVSYDINEGSHADEGRELAISLDCLDPLGLMKPELEDKEKPELKVVAAKKNRRKDLWRYEGEVKLDAKKTRMQYCAVLLMFAATCICRGMEVDEVHDDETLSMFVKIMIDQLSNTIIK